MLSAKQCVLIVITQLNAPTSTRLCQSRGAHIYLSARKCHEYSSDGLHALVEVGCGRPKLPWLMTFSQSRLDGCYGRFDGDEPIAGGPKAVSQANRDVSTSGLGRRDASSDDGDETASRLSRTKYQPLLL